MSTKPFAGKGLKAVFARVVGTHKNYVSMNMGVLAGATNPDTGEKIASYAIKQEYGSQVDGIPKRPALLLTAQNNKEEYAKAIATQIQQGVSAKNAMHVVGEMFKADFVKTVHSKPWRDNSEATKARKRAKGRTGEIYPLIDSGAYVKSIDYEIDE